MGSRFARVVCACAGPRLHAEHGASSVSRDAAPARQLLGPVGLKMHALNNSLGSLDFMQTSLKEDANVETGTRIMSADCDDKVGLVQ